MEKKKSFYSDISTRIITKIKIINTKLVNSSGFLSSEYILYIFKVITPFNTWYIKKRYSDIKNLFDYLVVHNKKMIFPAFPPKRFFSTKESTIIERKNGFEEIFSFILDNFEILKYTKLINFFKIKKNVLRIYIENCILVNENKYTYEILDVINSSSSSNDLSQNSDDSNKDKDKKEEKDKTKLLKIKKGKKIISKSHDKINNKKINQINEKKDLANIKENLKQKCNINNINEDINNNINNINNTKNIEKMKSNNVKFSLSNNGNYFRRFEDFILASKNYTNRSQASFLIIIEFLRNLKVHSSHIYEIINNFKDYLKYKNKWKKLNNKEIIALFIGINREELIDDYYQYILAEEKPFFRNSTSFSEKTTLSNTPNSISIINHSKSNNNIKNFNINNINIHEDDLNNKKMYSLEGLLYNIGQFEINYLGAKSCLLLLNQFFERQFNPEVDIYISIFRKLDINHIKKMKLSKFYYINNFINQKLCFDILNIYISGYDEQKQIKILNELNANDSLIDEVLEYQYKEDIIFNSYNLK